jgi:glycerol-1-phosphate dehydrogenase [NAD(P)+]
MILGGMKVTVSAKVPAAIFADTDVLKNAPMDMIQAGYGNIVGKFSALNDWRLSHIVNGEYFCQEIYDLTFEMVHKTLELGQGLIRREEHSVKVLMEALVIVGIAMSFAGSSRPASGSEHHLSHYFEITGIVRGEDYFPHGIDVAYSTVITAALREKLLTQAWPENQYRPDREAYVEEVSRIYGPVAE